MEYKKLARLSMFLSLSILLSMIESFFPILSGIIPGIKLGIANIIIVIVMFLYGPKEAFLIAILRVFLMGILRTGLFSTTFFFSLTGSIFSVSIMTCLYKSKLSIIGVSIMGSIFHSIGQIVTAMLLLRLPNLIYYLPIMILCSLITGMLTGFFAKQSLQHIKKRL